MEVLGAVAATVQLAEILTRSVITISKIYRRVADAPEYVQRANNQLNQLIALLTLLQPYLKFSASALASKEIYTVLEDCQQKAHELADVLERLLLEHTRSSWKVSWSAVKCLKKQERINQIIDHLERDKSTLVLWVAVGNQSSLTRIEDTLEHIRQIQPIDEKRELPRMETKRIPKSFQVQLYEKGNWHPSRSRSYGVTCSCNAKQITTISHYWGNTQLRTSSVNHTPDCPCTDAYERRFFVPSSFLRYAVQGSIVTYYMNGRHFLAHNLTCYRIVDETKSPSFDLFTCHFDHTSSDKRQLLPAATYDTNKTLESLDYSFREGKASPYDINQYGQTLLNVALQFFWALFQQGSLEYKDFARTIRYLTQSGVPLNEHGLSEGTPVGYISSLEENLMPRDDIDGESRKLSLVRHFLSEGGDYEENDDFIQYNGNNLGCSLFSMLPEFFEAANTSQAAKAVMDKDLIKLQSIIDNGGDLNRVNAWGTNAVLNARNYAPALKMLLEAGADPHTANKGGWNALSGAVAWHNRDCIDLLLEHDTAVTGLEILFGILAVREPEVQRLILDALADRRRRLQRLAMCHLTDTRYDHLRLNDPQPLDAHAREVVEALEARGIIIPAALETYSKKSSKYNHPPEPVYVLATMQSETYHLEPLLIDAFQLLVFFESIYSAGFCEFDVYNKDGMTPLMLCCSKGQWQASFWLLRKIEGPQPCTLAGGSLNALHCFAQSFGAMHGKTWTSPSPKMKNLVADLRRAGVRIDQPASIGTAANSTSTNETEGTRCYCCPNGQKPIVTLAKELTACLRDTKPETRNTFLSSTLLHEIASVWSANSGSDSSYPTLDDIYEEIVRQDTYNRIGLTHTCLDLRPLIHGEMPRQPFDADEVREIRDEEEELSYQLDDLMSSYARERNRYQGTRDEFHADWVVGLPDYFP